MADTDSKAMPWFIVAMLTLFMVLAFADRAVIGFAAVPLMNDLKMSPSQFGLASSAMYWLYPIAGIIGGFAVNRYPTRWVLAILAITWAIAQFPMLWATTPTEVVLARALLGLGEGPAFAVAMHACFKWFADDRRSLPGAIVSEGAAFGIILASPIVAHIIATLGWRTAFGILGATTLLWSVAWMATAREGKIQAARSGAPAGERVNYRNLLLDRTFIGNTLAGFAVACGITVFLSWLPPYLLKGLNYSTTQAGWLTTLPWLASIVLTLLGAAFSQRLLKRGATSRMARAAVLSCALAVGGLATIMMTQAAPGVAQLVLLSIGFGLPTLVWTLSPAIIGEVTPVLQRGAMLGIFTTIANSSAGSLAPYFMGVMVEKGATQADGYARGFIVLGALQILASVAAWFLIRPELTLARRQAERKPQEGLAAPLQATT